MLSLNIYTDLINPLDDRKCFITWLTSGIFFLSVSVLAVLLLPGGKRIFFFGIDKVPSVAPFSGWLSGFLFLFLCVSMGSEQWQQARCGSGGQELHPPCRIYGHSALSKPSHGVDPRQTEGPSEGGALGPGPQQPGLFCRTDLGYVSRSPSEGVQQLQQGTHFYPRLCI